MRTGAWPPLLFSLPRPPIRPAGHAWTRTVAHRRGLLAGWPVPAGSFSRHEEHRAHQATGTADKRGWTRIAAPRSGWQPTTDNYLPQSGRPPPCRLSPIAYVLVTHAGSLCPGKCAWTLWFPLPLITKALTKICSRQAILLVISEQTHRPRPGPDRKSVPPTPKNTAAV